MEDRLWRHPSEVGAAGRAKATVSVSTVRTSWKQAVGLASLGAIGGAIVVAGLFLSLGGDSDNDLTVGPIVSTLALDPMVPVERPVDAERWPAEVVEGVRPGIAQVKARTDESLRVGSGVLFRSDGLLLTSYDLIDGATEMEIVLDDGATHAGQVVGIDHISGVAVVRVEEMDLPTARLAIIKQPPQVGDYAVAVAARAAPDSHKLATVSSTSVSVPVDEHQHLHGLIQLDAGMPTDGSGGGVVDDSGAVIGIIVDVDTENATYAVPIGYARTIAEDMIRFGEARHPWLGIKGVDLDDQGQRDNELDGAVRITNVLASSPAHAVGIRKGDIITAVDGTPVLSMSELILELRRHPPGDDIVLSMLRSEQAREVGLELAVRSVRDTA